MGVVCRFVTHPHPPAVESDGDDNMKGLAAGDGGATAAHCRRVRVGCHLPGLGRVGECVFLCP
jgi:hypothetical protein